jgi:hypothetical protein
MTMNFFRLCTILALGFAASQTILSAQEKNGLDGIWSVIVTNCQTGAPIRTVSSLQAYRHDGSMIETVNTASCGISEGVWGYADDHTVAALYWFYRYNAEGAFVSRASVTDKIVLGSNGQFTSSVVVDYDANGNLLTTGCFTHTATRLTAGIGPHVDD